MNVRNNVRALLITAALGTAASSLALPVSAGTAGVPKVTVSYGDLNLSNPQAVAVLFGRIRIAAAQVCAEFDSHSVNQIAQYHGCVDDAIAGAVSSVNQPALSSLYSEKTGKSIPTRLASIQHP
jgi:UrcA family protein